MTLVPTLHILVVEDNDSLREATVAFLKAQGHHVTGVVFAEEVDDTPADGLPDLYLIDVNLPGEDGFSLVNRIRKSHPKAGIVMMTARRQLNDRLLGYAHGADNYLIKPVEQEELLACIKALGRRIKNVDETDADVFQLNNQTLTLKGPMGSVALTHSECTLLAALSRAAGQKLERWQALQLIDTNAKGLVPANLEMKINGLRKKLTACGATAMSIRTIRGYGYVLACSLKIVSRSE